MITKKIKYFLTFIVLLSVTNQFVLANTNIIDFGRRGSIQITLNELASEEPVVGAELTIYKIANVYSISNNLAIKFVPELSDCNVALTNLENSNTSIEINKCLDGKNLTKYFDKTNQDGMITFNDLSLGLYLVKQTNLVDGYSVIDPFITMIPKVIDNKWTYDIKANPKTDIIRLFDLTAKKEWNVPVGEKIPDSVTIELYKDNELIDTVVLNKDNNWMYTWKQIEKSDKYSIKEIDIPDNYKAIYQERDNELIVINAKKLVQTGFNEYIPLLLSFTGLGLVLLGVIFIKRNNYE